MQFYRIENILTPVTEAKTENGHYQCVAILNEEEWQANTSLFGLELDFDFEPGEAAKALETKAMVNYDSLTGSFFRDSVFF